MTPHPDFARFFNTFKSTPALFIPYQADVFRQTQPRWMSLPYRFTGVGSVVTGARWSAKSLIPALYASLDLPTLTTEVYQKALRYGWAPSEFPGPQLVVRMRWELQRVVDLTLTATTKALGVTKRELIQCDWQGEQAARREALTQAIGRAAFENLAEGLIVPSARQVGGVNMVYYPSHRQAGSKVVTADEADIPFVHGLA